MYKYISLWIYTYIYIYIHIVKYSYVYKYIYAHCTCKSRHANPGAQTVRQTDKHTNSPTYTFPLSHTHKVVFVIAWSIRRALRDRQTQTNTHSLSPCLSPTHSNAHTQSGGCNIFEYLPWFERKMRIDKHIHSYTNTRTHTHTHTRTHTHPVLLITF